jgi:hypothetical protein
MLRGSSAIDPCLFQIFLFGKKIVWMRVRVPYRALYLGALPLDVVG